MGGKALAWFMSASLVSLSLGLIVVNLLRPGDAMHALLPAAGAVSDIVTSSPLKEFISHLIPTSIIDGMAKMKFYRL